MEPQKAEKEKIGGQFDRAKRQEHAEKIIKVITENNMTYGEAMAVIKYLYDCLNNKGANYLDGVSVETVMQKSSYRYY